MALKATKKSGSGGGDFVRCPVGNHPAVCVAVIGAGTHTQQFAGKEPKDEAKLIFVWEIEADGEDGKTGRFFILKDFNLYFNEKSNLFKLVSGWFPARKFVDDEDVDFARLIKQPCLLNVTESKNGYPVVDSAKPVIKGMTALKPSVTPFVYDVESGEEYPAPAWVPYIWGKPMQDYLAECHERRAGPGDAAEPPAQPSTEEQAAEVF
jgi:hypothetical protein